MLKEKKDKQEQKIDQNNNRKQNDKKYTKNASLKNGYLMMTVLPLFAVLIILSGFMMQKYTNSMKEMNLRELDDLGKATVIQFDRTFVGDYALRKVKTENGEGLEILKGDQVISNKLDYFDDIKKATDTDFSLIYSDTRIISTLLSPNGLTAIGTGVSQQVMNQVYTTGESKQYDNVKIGNTMYLATYIPIKNTDGKMVGMLELARKEDVITAYIVKSILPLVLIAVGCIVFFGFISVRFANGTLSRIAKLEHFLTRVSDGNLGESIHTDVLKTKDEIGEAGYAAVSMQKSIRNLVEKDALTEIYNRRYATGYLSKTLHKAEVTGQPFAVCIADIDFFKKVNDTYGHDMGDVVLKEVAAILKNQMIGHGMAARFGGEEFLLVFDKKGMKEAAEILEQALEQLRRRIFIYENIEFHVTMTFGVVDGDVSLKEDELLKMADEKLYTGKEGGRNRVVV